MYYYRLQINWVTKIKEGGICWKVKTVVDVVQRQALTATGMPFYGLFNQTLPKRCWAADASRLVLSTPQQCKIESYVIDLGTVSRGM
jgi:hypothetical protein